YINAGSEQGIHEGQEFHAIRPKGYLKKAYQQKKGSLGVYVQEVGQLRVISVKSRFSVAQVTFSCDHLLLGDLLTGVPDRISPKTANELAIDRFSDPSGKPTGRIVLARDGREMVAAGDLIYVDIGAEDKVVEGDSLTIYRQLGKGQLFEIKNEELARR